MAIWRRLVIGTLVLLLLPLRAPEGQTPAQVASVTAAILTRCDTCQVLILGERHKQPESPQLFLATVQRLLEQGERVLVGLEVDQAQQAALDAVLAGKRAPTGVASYAIDSPFFRDMLRTLSRLSQRYGAALTVTALDDLSGPRDRDEAMADTLRTQLATGRFDRAIALVGNLHAIRQMRWRADAGRGRTPMAQHLVQARLRVTSVLQDLDAACAQPRQPSFVAMETAQGQAAVRQQIEVVKYHPAMSMARAADGIVVWQCAEAIEVGAGSNPGMRR